MRVTVLDNQGATFDRYTVAVEDRGGTDIYTMSHNPLNPQGVNMYSHSLKPGIAAKLLDNEVMVPVKRLPAQVQRAIAHWLSGYIN